MTDTHSYDNSKESDPIAARTRAFWNERLRDGQDAAADVHHYRYVKDPWLPLLIGNICETERGLLEVGCDQGTDTRIPV